MSGISKRVSGSWVSGDYGIMKTATDTITTLPADIYANDTTATVGLKGNMEQNGTPTPDSPIMPQSTGERTGNLFDSSTIEVGGLSPTTGAEITDNTRRRSGFISIEPSTNYGLSREITSSGSFFWVIAYDENKNIVTDATVSAQFSGVLVAGTSLTINQWTFTTTPTTKYIRWYVTVDNSYKNIMLNTGSTAKPFEPYGYKIPISSAGQTTPVYLGEVETTRRIRKLVLTGEETWTKGKYPISDSTYHFYMPNPTGIMGNLQSWIISHFVCGRLINGTAMGLFFNFYPQTSFLPENPTANDFKAWIAAQYAAGTPVTIWYVLAEPETGIVNEPIRKIGDYADTLSNAAQIPTTEGANSITVDTTVQPSEFTATWTGWHDAEVKEKSENLFDRFDIVGQVPSISNGQLIDYNGSTTSLIPIISGNITVTKPPTALLYLLLYAADMSYIGYVQNSTDVNFYGSSVTGYENAKYCRLRIDRTTGLDNIQIMINAGSTALPYEPYWE